MGGHVDDFHCAGNMNSPRRQDIRKRIDSRYRWGTVKINQYRHAGASLGAVQWLAFKRSPWLAQDVGFSCRSFLVSR